MGWTGATNLSAPAAGGSTPSYDPAPVVITPLSSGWTGSPTYQRDISGTVTLTGTISGGTDTVGTVLFTLPAARRPAADTVKSVLANGGAGGTTIKIAATGVVTINSSALPSVGSIDFNDATFVVA